MNNEISTNSEDLESELVFVDEHTFHRKEDLENYNGRLGKEEIEKTARRDN